MSLLCGTNKSLILLNCHLGRAKWKFHKFYHFLAAKRLFRGSSLNDDYVTHKHEAPATLITYTFPQMPVYTVGLPLARTTDS
jgi:hypothetical protein